MPSFDLSAQVTWLERNWVAIVVVVGVAYLVWRFGRPLIHPAVTGMLRAQRHAFADQEVPAEEVEKRAATIEQLMVSLLRGGILLAVTFLVMGIFDLWSAAAGLGLIAAAITLAGQSIVLDYLMGVIILVEGQYHKGDTISAGGMEGVVEEVGLRRTVLRDATGTVHSISNGQLRVVSNLTRIYASAVVDVPGIRERDVEAAIAVMDRVGAELAADPAWAERVLEAPRYTSTTVWTDLGVTLRMAGRVRPADRWAVPAELRRRLAPALCEAGIEPNRRTSPAGPTA